MTIARDNLNHAIANDCQDPDCELHNPEIIEGDAERLTAQAWFLAGAHTIINLIVNAEPEVTLFIEEDMDRSIAIALDELRDAHSLKV